ncbi:hypothetical protein [Sphingorhabdus sp.]|jgi:hypothetical protein|nr:hypothetical protein [Sphingorhabdus sp.]MDH4399194.1 hypothetical protein [Sphingorhabdus sp.]
MASSLTVTLNLVQGLSVKMAPVDLVPWMLKQVQHDTIVVTS